MHDEQRTMTGDQMKDQLQREVATDKVMDELARSGKGVNEFGHGQSGPNQQRNRPTSSDISGGHKP